MPGAGPRAAGWGARRVTPARNPETEAAALWRLYVDAVRRRTAYLGRERKGLHPNALWPHAQETFTERARALVRGECSWAAMEAATHRMARSLVQPDAEGWVRALLAVSGDVQLAQQAEVSLEDLAAARAWVAEHGRPTGWRWRRGTHAGSHVRDAWGTDPPPFGVKPEPPSDEHLAELIAYEREHEQPEIPEPEPAQ